MYKNCPLTPPQDTEDHSERYSFATTEAAINNVSTKSNKKTSNHWFCTNVKDLMKKLEISKSNPAKYHLKMAVTQKRVCKK